MHMPRGRMQGYISRWGGGGSQDGEFPRLESEHGEQEEAHDETCCGAEVAGGEG